MTFNNKSLAATTKDSFDFEELSKDFKFVVTSSNLHENLAAIEKEVEIAMKLREDSHLTVDDIVKLDNYLSYTTNSLYWIYLKLQGAEEKMDVVNTDITKIRQNMMRDIAVDTKAVAPRLDVPVARRFIGHAANIRFDDKQKEGTTSKYGNVDKPYKMKSKQEKPIPQREQSVSQPSPSYSKYKYTNKRSINYSKENKHST